MGQNFTPPVDKNNLIVANSKCKTFLLKDFTATISSWWLVADRWQNKKSAKFRALFILPHLSKSLACHNPLYKKSLQFLLGVRENASGQEPVSLKDES